MAAPDNQTLYAFSKNFDSCFKSILEANRITPVYVQGSKEKLKATRVEVQFTVTGELGHYARNAEGKWVPDAWNGSLKLTITADRTKNGTFVDDTKAVVSGIFACWKDQFTDGNLPYYTVVSFKDAGATPSIQTDKDRDIAIMMFTVRFNIRKSAWPAPMITYAASLDGLQWEMPCIADASGGPSLCSCVDPADVTAVMGGQAGTIYNVRLRFRGYAELKGYSGGAVGESEWLYVGGTPDDNTFNWYALEVSNPPQTYYVNRYTVGQSDRIDFEATIPIAGGATVKLIARSVDNKQNKNWNNITFSELTDPPQPYNGQFMVMNPVSVAVA